MLIKVCLLLLSVGVYASYADGFIKSTTEDPLFGELDFIFPQNFVSRFPENSEFFTTKILGYLLFNLFAKYLGEHEPAKFWSKFNHNDFNRVVIDAAFYEYLTKFVDGKKKHLVFDPLKSSTNPEDIAMHRIGDYLDNLVSAEVPSEETRIEYFKRNDDKCARVSVQGPSYGIPWKDFPSYCEIPRTFFTCRNRVPGLYGDKETECQVFHSCWPNRMDSFLCPIGTTFNPEHSTCDFWHKSDCLISSGRPQSARDDVQGHVSTTVVMDDAALTASESPSTIAPDYDGTCQSVFTEQMQKNMKFPPVKCKVTALKTSTPTDESSNLARSIADWIARDFKELSEYKREYDLRNRMQGVAKPPERDGEIPNLDSKVATVSSQHDDIDATSDQIYSSTTEEPYDDNDIFVEESVIKGTSPGEVTYRRTVTKSTLMKHSKPSEETIRRMFNAMTTSLELGSRMINEGLLPLVERIVLDSRRKKSKS